MAGQIAHKNIHSALAAAQAIMEPVMKGAINPAFKGEGKAKGTPYADYADVVAAVRGPLTSNGICFSHSTVRDEGVLHMRTSLHHGDSETRMDCDIPLIVAKNDMQGMKSATTYAKRIGLESLTGVAPEDDDGNAAAKAPPMVEDKPDALSDIEAFNARVKAVIKAIGNETTLDSLGAYWKALNANERAVAADGLVIRAKEDRKAALTVKDDLGGDRIPF